MTAIFTTLGYQDFEFWRREGLAILEAITTLVLAVITALAYRTWPVHGQIPSGVGVGGVKSPTHNLRIVEKKQAYQREDRIYFVSRYTGELHEGYFVNWITCPTGTEFRKGMTEIASYAPLSWRRVAKSWPSKMGALNGNKRHEERWSWGIPKDAPLGQYTILMTVRNRTDQILGIWKSDLIAEETDSISVS